MFIYNSWSEWQYPDEDLDNYVDYPYLIDGTADNSDEFPIASTHELSKPTITAPTVGETASGVITIQWTASSDTHSHSVTYSLYYSVDDGTTWILIASDITTTSYTWDTTAVNNGNYLIKVIATCSTGLTSEGVLDNTFTIDNVSPTTTTEITTTTIGTTEPSTTTPPVISPGWEFGIVLFLGIVFSLIKRRKS